MLKLGSRYLDLCGGTSCWSVDGQGSDAASATFSALLLPLHMEREILNNDRHPIEENGGLEQENQTQFLWWTE